jgi:hypothetical protein
MCSQERDVTKEKKHKFERMTEILGGERTRSWEFWAYMRLDIVIGNFGYGAEETARIS